MKEAVEIILELAKMLKWNLHQVYVDGSRAFMGEVASQLNSQVTTLKKDNAEIEVVSKNKNTRPVDRISILRKDMNRRVVKKILHKNL